MTDYAVPLVEIRARQEKIQTKLQESAIDGLFVVQRVDLFYFTGTAQFGFLFMPAEGEPVLFMKKYMPRAREESPLKNIMPINSVKDVPGLLSDMYGSLPAVLGLELDVLPVNDFNFFRSIFPVRDFVDASRQILEARMIKSGWEIGQMEKAAELSRDTFAYMKENIRPGLTELEFAGMTETFARKHGHGAQLRIRDYQTEVYPWHILSGKSGGMVGLLDAPASGEGTSAAFPCGAGNKKLVAGEPIMIDFGTVRNGYHLDETRMFAIGSMPDAARKACEASIAIHNAVLEKAKPGIALEELFLFSTALATSHGYAAQYLGPRGHKVTFIGHGVGLELVEPPFIAKGKQELLEAGMTFALEPKLVFEGEFSAGIESVFLVTERGARLLSKVPVEIFIVPGKS